MKRTALLEESEPLGFEEALGIVGSRWQRGGMYEPQGLGKSMNE